MKEQLSHADTCRICGRPLANPDEELCVACRQMEAVKARYIQTAPRKAVRRRMNPLTKHLLVAACVLTVIFFVLSAASVFLYSIYSPEKFLDTLDAALAAGDIRALTPLLEGEGLAVSPEGAAALCLAFEEADARAALREQLSAQIIDPKAQGDYPALRLVKTPVFLGYGRCTLGVRSVQLLLAAPARELRLSLGGVPCTGEQTANGILYQHLFPGLYACSVTGVTAAGQPVSGEVTPLLLFSTEEPTVFDGALPVSAVTVTGCVSDNAVISVDGAPVAQKPMHSVVTLPQVALGSVIRMEYTAPWGAVTRSEVAFQSREQTELAFTEFVTEGGVPSSEELTPLISIFFGTYLDAINNQDPARISGCTEECRAAMNAADGSEYQTGHLFLSDAVACAPVVTSEMVDGAPHVTCLARMDYHIMNRTTAEERALVDFVRCTFVWQDGWVLNQYVLTDEAAYNAAWNDGQG